MRSQVTPTTIPMINKIKAYGHKLRFSKENPCEGLLSFTLKVIRWLLFCLKGQDCDQVMKRMLKVSSSFLSIAKSRGSIGFIRHCKMTRQALYISLSGEYPSKKIPGIEVNEEGVPTILKPYYKLISESRVSEPKH
jgi:hypothetical protein